LMVLMVLIVVLVVVMVVVSMAVVWFLEWVAVVALLLWMFFIAHVQPLHSVEEKGGRVLLNHDARSPSQRAHGQGKQHSLIHQAVRAARARKGAAAAAAAAAASSRFQRFR
jgi:hypothetical protein